MAIPRLLVVDDDPDMRAMLTQFLRQNGVIALPAATEADIRRQITAERVDLILLDVMMPIVSGFDALATLKADPRTVQIPVIMVTAKGQPDDVALARSLGALEYIIKPWGEGDVELIVDWALSASKAS